MRMWIEKNALGLTQGAAAGFGLVWASLSLASLPTVQPFQVMTGVRATPLTVSVPTSSFNLLTSPLSQAKATKNSTDNNVVSLLRTVQNQAHPLTISKPGDKGVKTVIGRDGKPRYSSYVPKLHTKLTPMPMFDCHVGGLNSYMCPGEIPAGSLGAPVVYDRDNKQVSTSLARVLVGTRSYVPGGAFAADFDEVRAAAVLKLQDQYDPATGMAN